MSKRARKQWRSRKARDLRWLARIAADPHRAEADRIGVHRLKKIGGVHTPDWDPDADLAFFNRAGEFRPAFHQQHRLAILGSNPEDLGGPHG